MRNPTRIPEETELAILEALRTGVSQNSAAKKLAVRVSTVNRIAKANGLQYSAPKNAAAARRDYAQKERLALLNEGFDKAREMLHTTKYLTPDGLQKWSTALGILIDKRRLEDGEATSRQEMNLVDPAVARERVLGQLTKLAVVDASVPDAVH